MARRKPIRADELMRQLESDPEWVRARDERDRRVRASAERYAADEAGLVAELHDAGCRASSVWDLVNNAPHPILERPFVGPYSEAYPILVRHLDEQHLDRVREGIVRALTVRDGGDLVMDALFRHFKQERDSGMRWVLANALRVAMPYSRRRKHPEIKQVLDGARGAG